jgi:hypothetical protein
VTTSVTLKLLPLGAPSFVRQAVLQTTVDDFCRLLMNSSAKDFDAPPPAATAVTASLLPGGGSLRGRPRMMVSALIVEAPAVAAVTHIPSPFVSCSVVLSYLHTEHAAEPGSEPESESESEARCLQTR